MGKKTIQSNWPEDQYAAVLIQRNLMIVFAIFLSISLLIALISLKQFYNTKNIEPYIIEYNADSGILTKIDSVSKKEYTANQSVRESLLYQYLLAREKINPSNIEDSMNFVRINSTPELYADFAKISQSTISELKNFSQKAFYDIQFKSFTYLSANKVEIKFISTIRDESQIYSSRESRVVVGYRFVDLDLLSDEVLLNPLGFQVTSYMVRKEQLVNQ